MSNLVRNLIITVIIFSIIVVGITLILIVKKNNATNSKPEIKIIEDGIDLYGTYDQNDILIKDKTSNYNGLKITVPVIEGLKNNEIEQKINNSIE